MNKKKVHFCPRCEVDKNFSNSVVQETCIVKNEKYVLGIPVWVCEECGESIVDEAYGDPVEKSFDAYRKKHNLMAPDEIKRIRKRWGLSQVSLAALLGMSQATINRYEGGSIQNVKEDGLIRACDDPRHMRDLLRRKGHLLDETQRKSAESKLDISVAPIALHDLVMNCQPGEISIRSGYRRFDFERFSAAAVWLCGEVKHVTKTKLNKLLFYSDYLCFEHTGCSLTGTIYRRLPYGPVPDGFNSLNALMVEGMNYLKIREVEYGNGNIGEEFYLGENAAGLKVKFNGDELRVLKYVRDHLGAMTPTKISDKSHDEPAWKQTHGGEVISYEWASKLSIAIPE